MQIQPGQTYRAADPRDNIRIRIKSYIPGENRALVVDAVTGKRPRPMLVTALHTSPTTQAGKPRRSGYVLEQPAAARQTTGQDDTDPVPTPEEGIEDARKAMQHVLQLFLDRVPRDELDAETMADSLADALSDGLTELYRAAHPAVGQPASEYPRQDGSLTVLGPEIFASADGQVISWRGLNYVPQVDAQPLAEIRRDIHEALVALPAPEADRVRALVAHLETVARAAVGQPAEAHDTEARPPREQWRVEGYDADVWLPVSRAFATSADAHARKRVSRRYPDMPTRVVRETTTWTVEDER